jgi:hypothetical protein
MRDIREDLKERIDLLARTRQMHEIEIASLAQQSIVLESLLEQENQRVASSTQSALTFVEPPPARLPNGRKYSTPLSLAVIEAFRTHNPATLGQLKNQAARDRVEFGGKHPGRAIHFLLLGMEQNGLVERTEDGRWRLIKNLFGEGNRTNSLALAG